MVAFLCTISFGAYLILMFTDWHEWSHLPLHFFAILSVTCLLLFLEERVSKLFIPKPQLFNYLSLTSKSFKMLGISLYRVHNDKKAYTKFIALLLDDSKPKIDLKFLLMDPDSLNLRQRQIEEDGYDSFFKDKQGNETFRLREECIETKEILSKIQKFLKKKEINHNFNFYTYDMMPKHSMIIIDDDYVNVGPYLFNKRGIQTESIEINDEKSKKKYIEEFDFIWKQEEEKANMKKTL